MFWHDYEDPRFEIGKYDRPRKLRPKEPQQAQPAIRSSFSDECNIPTNTGAINVEVTESETLPPAPAPSDPAL